LELRDANPVGAAAEGSSARSGSRLLRNSVALVALVRIDGAGSEHSMKVPAMRARSSLPELGRAVAATRRERRRHEKIAAGSAILVRWQLELASEAVEENWTRRLNAIELNMGAACVVACEQ
jgi:hypothetical protein